MNLRIRRRRFGQLAIASAAAATVSNLAKKVIAQQPQLLYGVRLTPASSRITEDIAGIAAADKTPAVILQAINLAKDQELPSFEVPETIVQNRQVPTVTLNKALVIKRPSERITGFTALSDGTLVIAVLAVTKRGDFIRLISVGGNSKKRSSKGLKVKKIGRDSTVESLLATQDNQLLSLVSLNQGVPPFELAVINSKSGQVDSGATLGLPGLVFTQRFGNLAQSPDGKIYATNLGSEGVTRLVELDLKNKSLVTGKAKVIDVAQLSYNNQPLENDLLSLAFSPSGQLFALANLGSEGTNSLFTVNLKSGEMKLERSFEVDKITFSKV